MSQAGTNSSGSSGPSGSAFTNINSQVFTSSGTYTPSNGLAYAIVEVVGAGGGGGATTTTTSDGSSSSGGGGGGGYARKVFPAATLGSSQTITVGAGGSGGVVPGGTGSTGGTTSVGSLISATGGSGGVGAGNDTSNISVNSGGAGGVGVGGDFNANGGPGGAGFAYAVGFQGGISGQGGNSIYGGGGLATINSDLNPPVSSNPGTNYGGGGSGNVLVTPPGETQKPGGNGAPGIVIITEFLEARTGSGNFVWVDVTGSTQSLVTGTGYVTDNAGGVVYTLPASGTLGDTIKILGKLGLTTITPNSNQQILIGSASGTVGVTGTAVGNNVGDCIELICITPGASTVWRSDSIIGTWTLN